MDPKDPHLIIKCARILMTLPTRVRDFDLGKQYLTKAFLMAPNDVTVLKAIENAVQTYENGGIVGYYILKKYPYNVVINCFFVLILVQKTETQNS